MRIQNSGQISNSQVEVGLDNKSIQSFQLRTKMQGDERSRGRASWMRRIVRLTALYSPKQTSPEVRSLKQRGGEALTTR
jgi:hypothetical protein